jgi:hypothetical protein
MAEPTAQRMRGRFTVKRADNGRILMAWAPVESESQPVIPGSDPTESEAAITASDPTATEAVIRGSERDPTLIAGVFAFELKEGVTEEHATQMADRMTDMLSHLMYTPLEGAFLSPTSRGFVKGTTKATTSSFSDMVVALCTSRSTHVTTSLRPGRSEGGSPYSHEKRLNNTHKD